MEDQSEMDRGTGWLVSARRGWYIASAQTALRYQSKCSWSVAAVAVAAAAVEIVIHISLYSLIVRLTPGYT